MIGKLNHVGIATPSIETSVAMYRDLLGATSATERRALPEQGCGSLSSTCPILKSS